MSILAWLVLGLIAGFIASKIVNKSGQGLLLDIVIGIVGAMIGGALFNTLGGVGVTGFNLWSLFVAVIGAVIALLLYHAVARRSRNL
ncbi:MAG TPA: GlsB/YeaQ/YmgE family stress response membrane protein [Magnetospirillum sp.]|nr:GlsB/YeaQ/YmgE family stress response membrane protein [Magnetospirillum sp.]